MMAAASQARAGAARAVRMPRFDYLLLFGALALVALGLVMVSSASITLADRELGQPFYYAIRQLIYIVIGIGTAMLLFRVRLALLEQAGLVALAGGLALLVAVIIPGVGHEVNGSVRWINTGLFK